MTKYGVFIIESLRKGEYWDGKNLSKILALSKINNAYHKVQSKEDFIESIRRFKKSEFRYLHISCHSDKNGIEIDGEEITNKELIRIFKNKIIGRRLFLSACQGSNKKMATVVLTKCGGQSLIGTPTDLHFDKAALFWPSFYHVINNIDKKGMNKRSISSALKKCVELFEIPINYYHKIENEKEYLRCYKFRYNKETSNRKISVANKI
jgi:hypothetical protein